MELDQNKGMLRFYSFAVACHLENLYCKNKQKSNQEDSFEKYFSMFMNCLWNSNFVYIVKK